MCACSYFGWMCFLNLKYMALMPVYPGKSAVAGVGSAIVVEIM